MKRFKKGTKELFPKQKAGDCPPNLNTRVKAFLISAGRLAIDAVTVYRSSHHGGSKADLGGTVGRGSVVERLAQ